MRGDRYLKIVLTIIAMELLWIGIKNVGDPVSAQAPDTRVVITGVDIDGTRTSYLPIAVIGNVRTIPLPLRSSLEPPVVRLSGPIQIDTQRPLKIEADRPLKIEADRPLKVESVPYTPTDRPGD